MTADTLCSVLRMYSPSALEAPVMLDVGGSLVELRVIIIDPPGNPAGAPPRFILSAPRFLGVESEPGAVYTSVPLPKIEGPPNPPPPRVERFY